MVATLPTPVAAALGVVPTVLHSVRQLPGKAIALPLHAVGAGVTGLGKARHAYGELADRGELLLGRMRGEAKEFSGQVTLRADTLEDRLEDLLTGTEVGDRYDTVEEALEDASDSLRARLRGGGDPLSLADELQQELTADSAAGPTPEADLTPEVDLTPVPSPAAQQELPLPDYDQMTLGSLRGRLRSLSVDDLTAIRAYEKAHADRLPVLTMLDNRLARLTTDAAVTGSGGSQVSTPKTKPAAQRVAKGGAAKGGAAKGKAPKGKVAKGKVAKGKVAPATAAPPTGAPTGSQPGLPLN